jgi:hypothetical protein
LLDQRLRADTATSVAALAEEVGRHPTWLGAAYKLSQGGKESLRPLRDSGSSAPLACCVRPSCHLPKSRAKPASATRVT